MSEQTNYITHLNDKELRDKALREKVGFDDIPQDSTLKDYIDTEVQDLKTELLGEGSSDSEDTIRKNKAAIEALTDTYNKKVAELEAADTIIKADINTINTTTLPNMEAALIGDDNEDTAESDTIKGAKKYADDKISTLGYSDSAVSTEFVTAVSQVNGIISVARSQLNESDIPSISHEKISDFDTAVKDIEVTNATNATNDSNGNNISETYATKQELSSLELIDTNIILKDGLKLTQDFGYYKLSEETMKDENGNSLNYRPIAPGTTLNEFLKGALTKEYTNIKNPTYTISVTSDQSGEVGSEYSKPTWKLIINSFGEYPYGYCDEQGNTLEGDKATTKVSFYYTENDDVWVHSIYSHVTIYFGDSGVFTDTPVTYKVTPDLIDSYGYQKGNTYAKTNLGTPTKERIEDYFEKAEGQTTYTGYRYAFAGATSSDLDSELIRTMSAKKNSKNAMDSQGEALDFIGKKGDSKIFFAYPATWAGTPYFEMFGLAWGENSNFKQVDTIEVGGYNNNMDYATDYKVYVWEPEAGPLVADSTKFRVWFK